MKDRDNSSFESLWLKAGKKSKEREYWLHKLAGELVKSSFPAFEEQAGSPGAAEDAALLNFSFKPQVSAGLLELSAGSDIRLYIVLVSFLTILLAKYSGNDDIILGMPVLKTDNAEELINKVALIRNRLNDDMTFKELLLQVRQAVTEADEHRNYPLQILLHQLNLPAVPFSVAILLENIHDKRYLDQVNPEVIFSFLRSEAGITGQIEFPGAPYMRPTMERAAGHFQELAGQVLADADISLPGIDLLLPEERKRLLFDFNDTAAEYPFDKTLQRLFTEQVGNTPHHTAVVGQSETLNHPVSLTYDELNRRSEYLAGILIEKGAGSDAVIGILAGRTIEMIVGILAILKAGGAYLPIDPQYPQERIDFMLSDSGAAILLTQRSFLDMDRRIKNWQGDAVFIEECRGDSPGVRWSPTEFFAAPSAGGLAYVIYTSGTTGRPKGVMVEHGNVVNLVYGLNRIIYSRYRDHLNVALVAPYIFDASVQQIFAVLLLGHSLWIVPRETRIDGGALKQFYREYGIDISDGTPTHLRLMVEEGGCGSSMKHFIIGGEALPRQLTEDFLNLFAAPAPKITNVYGPTECCVDSTFYEILKEEIGKIQTIPIGKPMPNEQIYIVNRQGLLQPLGVLGELCIGGTGVARGYLNKPELTAEKIVVFGESEPFCKKVPTPPKTFIESFCGGPGGDFHEKSPLATQRLYKTGDMARWLPDGNIAFAGRIDHQVKIRGFRIELGEIESRLTAEKEIKETVVIDRENEAGDRYLCAYLVPRETQAAAFQHEFLSDLRNRLRRTLPDYMIPTFFIPIAKIPITANGKLDRKALPEPQTSQGEAVYSAPQGDSETKLAAIWARILKLNREPGREDHFFERGGHSLSAAALVYQVYKVFAVNIEVAAIFEHPILREQAQLIKEAAAQVYHEIRPVEEKEYYDLSYAQRRLWIISQFEKDSTAYNMPAARVLSGVFDCQAFTRAMQTLAQRHESLRTIFITLEGEPHQKILKHSVIQPDFFDLRLLPTGEQEEKARQIFTRIANYVFDLEKGPLLRFTLIRLADEKYLLFYNIHHIINDGWSQGIISREIFTLYNVFVQGQGDPLAALELQYKDYACWHNSLIQEVRLEDSRQYWLEKFGDAPNGIELPLDHPRKAIQTFNGSRVVFLIDNEKAAQLQQLSRQEDATIFMTLLTLLEIFLYRYTGQQNIIIGAPSANRERPEFFHLVGFLVNTLVYRNELNPGDSFRRRLAAVKQEALACYRNQDYPFDLLVEELGLDRDMSRSPLFNVMIAYNDAETGSAAQTIVGVEASEYPYSEDFNMSKFDLIFFLDEVETGIKARIEYNSDLFERSTIERMCDNFLALALDVLAGGDTPINRLNIISQAEYETVMHRFNETACSFDGINLVELFEKQATAIPGKIALVGPTRNAGPGSKDHDSRTNLPTMTYKELNCRANRLAHYLVKRYGVQTNDVIVISMDRSCDMIVALLGIMKAGAAYLAIDPTYPETRIAYMLKDSSAALVIADRDMTGLFRDYPGNIIDIRLRQPEIDLGSAENEGIKNRPTDIVYVTYTSGSTGDPNGAMVSHAILTNLIRWQGSQTSIDGALRCLQFASLNFDVSFQEIMATLTAGGELHLIGEIERKDAEYLMDFLEIHGIEVLYLPFYYLNFLFTETDGRGDFPGLVLKHIVTAGEQLIITPGLKLFLEANPAVLLHNHYGPAEMHVVTSYTLTAGAADSPLLPPIGKPIANTGIYILDDYQNLLPIGAWGEIYIAGAADFAGYLNKPVLTAEKLCKGALFEKTAPLTPAKAFNESFLGVQGPRRGHPLSPTLSSGNIIEYPQIDHCPLNAPPRSGVLQKSPLLAEGAMLYKTGDIGRWLPDGNIELKGRKDFQVKIRGFRVELGEIESKILSLAKIRECVVVVKEDKNGRKFLAAYAAGDDISPEGVRKNLAAGLPQYMIPRIVVLDRLPLLPNGKVDRRKLPEPTFEAEQEYTPPADGLEEALQQIWAAVLEIPEQEIGVETNFFELGGHSLKAAQLKSHIYKKFGAEVPLAEVFKLPTIREMTRYLKNIAGHDNKILSAGDRISRNLALVQEPLPVEKRDYYPLTAGQRSLYVLQQMNPGNLSYNMPVVLLVQGEVDKARFAQVFARLLARHESLRTSFRMLEAAAVQQVHEFAEIDFKIEYHEDCELQDTALVRSFIRPFDLSCAPLLRVSLVKTAPGKYVLICDMHHIAADGVTLGIFTREFMSRAAGNTLPHLKLQYKDFAMWRSREQEGGRLMGQERYWLTQFAGEIPVLDLPTDFARPRVQGFVGRTVTFEVGKKETAALKKVALGAGATLYMVLLSAYYILLARLSGQEDIVVGTPAAGRGCVDLEPVSGMFVNTLCLRNYPQADKSIRDFLAEVKETALQAFDNQDFQFEDLAARLDINRDGSRNPIFDAMFALQNMDLAAVELPGLKIDSYDYDSGAIKFDLNLHGYERGAGLSFTFQYSTELFKAQTIDRYIKYFKKIIAAVIENPRRKISDLEILLEEEKRRLLIDFNDTRMECPADETLPLLFSRQAERTPQDIALVQSGCDCVPHYEMNYRELAQRVSSMSSLLKEKGVMPGAPVGLLLPRSIEAVIVILAVLQAGAAFLSIDPDYPPERIGYMLADSAAQVVVTTRQSFNEGWNIKNWRAQVVFIDECRGDSPGSRWSPDHQSSFGSAAINGSPESLCSPGDVAYIIYTSGSTGLPRGVMITHRSAVNYITWAIRQYVQQEQVNFPLFTSLAFDLTITSIFTPLLSGNTLVVYGDGVLNNSREEEPGALIRQILVDDRAGVVKLTPAHLKLILALPGGHLPNENGKIVSRIKRFIVGGEALETHTAGQVVERFYHPIEIYNEYGPTEATVGCMIYRFDPEQDKRQAVPIGKPAGNVQIFILDRSMNSTPQGTAGEIYIAGVGVAAGYLNRPGLTAERFLASGGQGAFLKNRPLHPQKTFNRSFCGGQGGSFLEKRPLAQKLYKTGDMARFLSDGNIEFIGRIDQQVKIRGYRVELGEIESALKSFRKKKHISISPNNEIAVGTNHHCTKCLLPGNFPGIRFDAQGVCNVCREYEKYKNQVDQYFKEEQDFVRLLQRIKEQRSNRVEYDCVLLFSGGKDSSYVLYRLIDYGLKVLTFTFDNGYISDAAFANIKRITQDLGVDNIICRANKMDRAFVESLHSENSVCHGCWNALNTLGAKAAYERGIDLVISGLSKGQIFEMRLEGLFSQGIFDQEEIEENLLLFRKSYHSKNNKFARILDVALEEEIIEQIHFVDFFRYFPVSVKEIREYLTRKGWVQPADTGFCSSNCLINDVGIYVFMKERGYHFYAAPLSWDCRLGVLSREQGMKELGFACSEKDLEMMDGILRQVGYYDSPVNDALVIDRQDATGDRSLTAYIVPAKKTELTEAELREYLAGRLPDYMIPTRFIQLEGIPLTANGKLDRKALERAGRQLESGRSYVAPRNEIEAKLTAIWSEILGLEQISIDANFFELGGNSLSLLRLAARIAEVFNKEIPVGTMFRLGAIQGLAQYLQDGEIDLQLGDEILEGAVDTMAETMSLLGEMENE